ncbi:MAG TPA: hypothetical protein VK815_17310 [Candidatus Acidoferrales bacterium]|jgi:hypothetical protein|nr:hypothetical protein [Candidatus Acidoferrales bacterium]
MTANAISQQPNGGKSHSTPPATNTVEIFDDEQAAAYVGGIKARAVRDWRTRRGLVFIRSIICHFMKPQWAFKILGMFAWFCSKRNRKKIQIITADLKKDIQKIRLQQHSGIFIQCVMLWHVIATVCVIFASSRLRRFVVIVVAAGKIIRMIKEF